ncbi:hypothetical protein GF386_02100 [Candidatus Pacearchaeota archaeon]|nr:hypothetical protein [Candidatus Pacearchaeota archaeon]MBD3282960.1 hypothetical protein [Candidatus Pacearchaeota archaeon]
MNKKKWIIAIALISVLLVLFLALGIYGGLLAEDPGITCDFGIGRLCWKWHKNLLGKARDLIEDASLDKIGENIKNFIENKK